LLLLLLFLLLLFYYYDHYHSGFNMPTVDHDTLTVNYPDMFTLTDHLQGESCVIF
jgi:cytochrome oxidase Cu insertion factor (SCO1/SenC/PrrC family)